MKSPLASLAIIANLVIIEGLLSVDNAAVMATIVIGLPKAQRGKAMNYGLIGAYLFRAIALFLVSLLIHIWWLKPLGGAYLVYLSLTHKGKSKEEKNIEETKNGLFSYKGKFWPTVLMLQMMDAAFSLDNIFAAVAFTPNILLICLGIIIGMLAIRFVAGWLIGLMEKIPAMETAAYYIIGILGMKLIVTSFAHFMPGNIIVQFLTSDLGDTLTSVATIVIFLAPVAQHYWMSRKLW